jgi:hypothetical protein
MTKLPPAPLRHVKRSQLGPRSQRLTLPDGAVAIVCGPPLRTDTLECGHKIETYGGYRKMRRCEECRHANQEQLL